MHGDRSLECTRKLDPSVRNLSSSLAITSQCTSQCTISDCSSMKGTVLHCIVGKRLPKTLIDYSFSACNTCGMTLLVCAFVLPHTKQIPGPVTFNQHKGIHIAAACIGSEFSPTKIFVCHLYSNSQLHAWMPSQPKTATCLTSVLVLGGNIDKWSKTLQRVHSCSSVLHPSTFFEPRAHQ